MVKVAERKEKPALDGLYREQVAALSPVDRERRRMRMLATPGQLTVKMFARATGLTVQHFYRMRTDFLANGGVVTPSTTPTPDPEINGDGIRRPGDGRTGGGIPAVWLIDTALAWLVWSGRGDEDFVPTHRGRPAPGRPPQQRTKPLAESVPFEAYLARIRAEVAAYHAREQLPAA